mmetsp:Transcript_24177/g.39193  ORF Transcript_24177/g.39193 Transcript_24177/m.39193 type:complete len:102 (-) Transcript_24177:484-789(-)
MITQNTFVGLKGRTMTASNKSFVNGTMAFAMLLNMKVMKATKTMGDLTTTLTHRPLITVLKGLTIVRITVLMTVKRVDTCIDIVIVRSKAVAFGFTQCTCV